MEHGKRNTAFLFIGAGLYLAIGHLIDFTTAGAIVIGLLGFAILRTADEGDKKNYSGYLLLGIAGIALLSSQLAFVAIAALIVGGIWYYRRSREQQPSGSGAFGTAAGTFDPAYVKQHIVASIRWGRGGESWAARSSQVSVAIAEVQIDLTNAIFEEPLIHLDLQGLIGDIDIVVPDDIGLSVHAQVAIGEIKVAGERGAGLGNKLIWRSPNFDTAEHRVELTISYTVADVDVKVL